MLKEQASHKVRARQVELIEKKINEIDNEIGSNIMVMISLKNLNVSK